MTTQDVHVAPPSTLSASTAPQVPPRPSASEAVAWPTRDELCDAIQRCIDEAVETAQDGDPEGSVVSVEAAEAFAKMLDAIYAHPAERPAPVSNVLSSPCLCMTTLPCPAHSGINRYADTKQSTPAPASAGGVTAEDVLAQMAHEVRGDQILLPDGQSETGGALIGRDLFAHIIRLAALSSQREDGR